MANAIATILPITATAIQSADLHCSQFAGELITTPNKRKLNSDNNNSGTSCNRKVPRPIRHVSAHMPVQSIERSGRSAGAISRRCDCGYGCCDKLCERALAALARGADGR